MSSRTPPALSRLPDAPARYIMLGGFLGAGKTTAVAALAQRLSAKGLRVGLITNDQGSELVDTAMLRARGFATEEIPGGCFCCRFNSLVSAAERLDAASRPDVFVAEPVGSCTDLVATVTYPLRRIYGDQFSIAPLSVLVDPIRAERLLGLADGGRFSPKVQYIYRKQLEEADYLVITKTELLDAPRLGALHAALASAYPQAEVFEVSVRTGHGIDEWFSRLETHEQIARATMEVDYATYAEGEALLGWLNATVSLASPGQPFDAGEILQELADDVQRRLSGAEIAHLKMTFSPEDSLGGVAAINLVRSDYVPELSIALEDAAEAGMLIINLRAEAAPDMLRVAVEEAVQALGARHANLRAVLEHQESFRPGKPEPTHRDTALAG